LRKTAFKIDDIDIFPLAPKHWPDEVFKKYKDGLCDMDGFSHIVLIFRFHRSRGYRLKVKPFLDNKLRGLFTTRAPRRPNQLGVSIVKLVKRRGNILTVKGVDMLDGTPLLDIKPYIPNSNPKRGVKIGWLEGKKK
jgi:tRNA-Thr(GGU) m(6)t(6)A37 methyltransferase TsaA